jgi:hypothetical protein
MKITHCTTAVVGANYDYTYVRLDRAGWSIGDTAFPGPPGPRLARLGPQRREPDQGRRFDAGGRVVERRAGRPRRWQ